MYGAKKCTPDHEVASGEKQDSYFVFLILKAICFTTGTVTVHTFQESLWDYVFDWNWREKRIEIEEKRIKWTFSERSATWLSILEAYLIAQLVKKLPSMQETQVGFLGREDPLEKEMATNSSNLAWRISWAEKPCRLQSLGSQELDTT